MFRLTITNLACVLIAIIAMANDAFGGGMSCERLFETYSPKLQLKYSADFNSSKRVRDLNVATYNIRGFDIHKDQAGSEQPKSARAQALIVDQINRENSDILFLTEIENRNALNHLTSRLVRAYEPVLIEGNDRISEIAILVRKGLPLDFEFQSHRGREHIYLGRWRPLFSRDLMLVNVRDPGSKVILLTFAFSHLKSRRDHQSDRHSTIKRTQQIAEILRILATQMRRIFSAGTVIVGDLQSNIMNSSDFAQFWRQGYIDSLDLMNVPFSQRATYQHFLKDGYGDREQLDGILLSEELVHAKALKNAEVVPDRTLDGRLLPWPATHDEQFGRQTDHRMSKATINLDKVRSMLPPQ